MNIKVTDSSSPEYDVEVRIIHTPEDHYCYREETQEDDSSISGSFDIEPVLTPIMVCVCGATKAVYDRDWQEVNY